MAQMERIERYPGIYKRGGRFVATWRDNLGRQRQQSAPTLMAAKAIRKEKQADVVRGEYRSLSAVTFTDYAREWIETYTGRTAHGIRPDTREDYRKALGLGADGNVLESGAVPFFGRRRLAEIEPRDIRAYAAGIAARGVSRNTVRLALAPVKALLATAVEDGLIRSNPSAGLRNILPATEANREQVKALTAEELATLLGKIRDEWRLFFRFLAESGLRIGEAIELRWKDTDLGGRWISVERRYYRGNVNNPKGRRARRVRLTEATARGLWALRKQTRAADADLVFTSEKGERLDPSNLTSRVLKPAAQAAGVEWVSFHSFRHTAATLLFRGGWNAVQVQKFLGHADPGITQSVYVHLLPEDLPDPSEVFGGRGDSEVPAREDEKARNSEVGETVKALENREIPRRAETAQLTS